MRYMVLANDVHVYVSENPPSLNLITDPNRSAPTLVRGYIYTQSDVFIQVNFTKTEP